MAKQEGATEKATPKRLEKARKDGDVAKSKELGLFFSILALLILIFLGDWFVGQMRDVVLFSLELAQDDIHPIQYMMEVGKRVAIFLVPIMLIVFISAIINYVIQVRIMFTLKSIKPDFKRLGFKSYKQKVWGRQAMVELLKSLLIVLILSYVVYGELKDQIASFRGMMLLPWEQSVFLIWDLFKSVAIKVTVALFVISVVDFVYQKWEYAERLKMKKEDVKREHRENEGSPEVKGKQRQEMIRILEKEVMQKLGEATFVATNPTHYAVAIRYNRNEGNPRVIIKGVDHLALFMREVAKEKEIPLVENPPLARELYQRVVEGENIPSDLWQVIADILQELLITNKIKIE